MATKNPLPYEPGTAQNSPDLLIDYPEPPRRLFTDNVPLKHDDGAPAWDARRANKMRMRFAVMDRPAQAGMSLVAPVQPPVRMQPFSGTLL